MSDLVVIGGGAAGLFAAGFAAKGGASVTVLERGTRPARKLLITGKGRCNVTNNCSPEDFLRNVRTNPRFLYGAASAFSPADAMAFFESLGVPLKTERGGRVFPVSDRAADVADALVRFAKASGARLEASARVTDILAEGGGVRGVRLEDGRELSADAVLVATGGCSYPATGSTGDGWRLAKALGHTVVPARASLVPVRAKEPWCAELMGLSLKNVTLTLRDARGKAVFSELGEMLFTHFGVSGPLVLSASSYLTGDPGGFRMEIDLKPALDEGQLDRRLLADFAKYANHDFCNALNDLLPQKLIPVLVAWSEIPPHQKVHDLTREQRRGLVQLLKHLPIAIAGPCPVTDAIVTSGGIKVSEIDPKTMESKLVKGLYFAGELIDVDAYTGGFNLQIAWATGRAAGIAAASEEEL